MIRTILTFAFILSSLAAWSAASTLYYTVKFPDDVTVYGCGANAGITYPVIYKYGNCSFNVGVSYKDQIFYTNSTGGCYKILRTWKLLYWCDYDPNWPSPYIIPNPSNSDVGPIAEGNGYNHGYLQYTQVIKVIDTEAPVFIDCPTQPLLFCDYTNNDPTQYKNGPVDKCEGPVDLKVKVKDACSKTDINLTYRLFLDLDGNGSMETYISSSAPTAWPIEKTILGDTVMGVIKFPTGFGLPYGKHKVEWIANDNCGNETICKYEFIVKDCKPPTIVCHNGLSVNIMPGGMITIWATDFVHYAFDNCTPDSQIKFAISKASDTTIVAFPTGSTSVTFDCDELGKQYVKVWVQDGYGNADFCKTFITVLDNIGTCPPNKPFKGNILTDQQTALQGVQVSLNKNGQAKAVAVTDANGQFAIGSMPAGCNYTLVPALNAPAITGVNTMDALLVAGQVDNILPLTTPYQLLAANVDKAGGLSLSDIMNIVKVALGIQNDFPGNFAWQFVPQSHTFTNPLQPWSPSVPSSLTFCLSGDIKFDPDFVAIKTGDVDGSANADNFGGAALDDRSSKGGKFAAFQTEEQAFLPGEEVRVDIITPDLASLAAFQFTLQYDPTALSFAGIEPDLVAPDFIGQLSENRITAGWYSSAMLNPNVKAKNVRLRAFTLVFNSLQKGLLSKKLRMSSDVAAAEVYTRDLQTAGASLEFLPSSKASSKGPSLFAAQPNPASDRFKAAFYLPESGPATLTLTDARGQALQTLQANRERGYHEVEFEVAGAPAGLMFLHLNTPDGSDVQKVMKQ